MFADTRYWIFFPHSSLQTLSSIILITSRWRTWSWKGKWSSTCINWVILKSAPQVAQASCFLRNCYCRFITLWSTMLSCFSIRMLQVSRGMWYRQIFHWTVYGSIHCVNFIYTNKKGCDEIYLLDLSVCSIVGCSCLWKFLTYLPSQAKTVFSITCCHIWSKYNHSWPVYICELDVCETTI